MEQITIGSWERLSARARERWPVHQEGEGSIIVGDGARSFRLDRIEVAAFPERELAVARFVVCPYHELVAASALRINGDLAIGTLVLRGEVYELRQVVDLSAVTIERLELVLAFLAKLVGALRDGRRSRPVGDAFAMFAE